MMSLLLFNTFVKIYYFNFNLTNEVMNTSASFPTALSINHNMYINGIFLFYLLFNLHQLILLHCTACMEQYPLLVPVTLHYGQQVIEMSVEPLLHLLLTVSSRIAGALTKYHRIFLPF